MTLKDTIECMNRIDKPLDRITEIYESRTIGSEHTRHRSDKLPLSAVPPRGENPPYTSKTEQ